MGSRMRQRIVLSGVNLVDMGPLNIFRGALQSLVRAYGDECEIIAIVHRRELFDIPNITYIEFPRIKSSWLRRLWFEYRTLKTLSKELSPRLWLSMHDMTPNVTADIRAVYCHNPSPFYSLRLRDAILDPTFALFVAFYRYLYRINLKRNNFVIVQQDWIRKRFERSFGLRNVIVARPSIDGASVALNSKERTSNSRFVFFYPAFPRTFKNFEVVLEAARILEESQVNNFELWLTVDATVNSYAARLVREYSGLHHVRWLGLLSIERVFALYGKAGCLMFPSRLETWGLPITEFKTTGKPILAADLPYAHETLGNYDLCAFFDPDDPANLAEMMRQASTGEPVFAPSRGQEPEKPYARNWSELWPLLAADPNSDISLPLPKEKCYEAQRSHIP
jgi:glycosyltransferase involved in cell wall biosynthesis